MATTLDTTTWALDAATRRGGVLRPDVNVVARQPWAPGIDAGAVWQVGTVPGPAGIAMLPPSKIYRRVFVPRADGGIALATRALAIDQGRVWASQPWSDWAIGRRFSAFVSTGPSAAGCCEGLVFRVFVERRELRIGAGNVTSRLAAEVVVRPGDAPVELSADVVGLGRCRLILEVESFGPGQPLVGLWARARLGTAEEFTYVSGTVGIASLLALATEHGGSDPDPTDLPKAGPLPTTALAAVYDEEPDDPYLIVVPFAVDGTSVTGPLSADPPSAPTARVEGGPGGFRDDLGISAGALGDHLVYAVLGWQFYPFGSVQGWTGGLQPGQASHSGSTAEFSLRQMGGDGEPGGSFIGALVIVLDQEGDVPPSTLGQEVATAFRSALEARLVSVLNPGVRTGLTEAEAAALRAEIPTIAAGVLASQGVPLIAATLDQLVGLGTPTWGYDELAPGGGVPRMFDVAGSGSSYRIQAVATVS